MGSSIALPFRNVKTHELSVGDLTPDEALQILSVVGAEVVVQGPPRADSIDEDPVAVKDHTGRVSVSGLGAVRMGGHGSHAGATALKGFATSMGDEKNSRRRDQRKRGAEDRGPLSETPCVRAGFPPVRWIIPSLGC